MKTKVGSNRFFIISACASLALFFAATFFVSFPFIYDDYSFLSKSYAPSFSLSAFGLFFSRMPVAQFLNFVLYKYHLWEHSWGYLYLFYAAQVAGFILILKWCSPAGDGEQERRTDASGSLPYGVLIAVLCFHPNLYEVLFWTTAMSYTLGPLFVGLGLFSKNRVAKVILFSLAFLTSEMFVTFSLSIILIPIALQKTKTVREQRPQLVAWAFGILVYVIIRLILAQFFETRAYNITFSFANLIDRSGFYLRMVYDIQFFRLNWVATLFDWLAVSLISYFLIQKRLLPWTGFAFIFGLLTLSALPNFLLVYDAPRAFYATLILKSIILLTLSKPIFTDNGFKKFRLPLVILFTLMCVSGNSVVLFTKNRNSLVLAQKERELISRIESCADPCSLEVADVSSGLKGDYTLPREVWTYFLEWVRIKNFPQKSVTFKITDLGSIKK